MCFYETKKFMPKAKLNFILIDRSHIFFKLFIKILIQFCCPKVLYQGLKLFSMSIVFI